MKLKNNNSNDCCKGKRISELEEKIQLQGTEYLAYQEGEENGKLSLNSLKDYLIELVKEYLINNGIIRDDYVQSEPAFKLLATLPELIADRACKDEFGNNINDTYLTRDAVKAYIQSIYEDLFTENPPHIMDGYITVDMLSEAVLQLLNSGGAITNFPDEEDLTVKDGKLKFNDKEYDPNKYSGLGRVMLRRNMVDGVNVLTQEMVSKPNTRYIIQYDFDLRGETINVPDNCILHFVGGSLNNGTINGNDTKVINYFSGDAITSGVSISLGVIADEEDLTLVDDNNILTPNILKLKDKEYDPANFSGLGRVYLRKNISNGKNILTQDMISKANTRYIIQYDYNLDGQTINIPDNCVLEFEGGSLSNGTLNGINTVIYSAPNLILKTISLTGLFTAEAWFLEWVSNNSSDYSEAFNILHQYKFPKTIKLIKDEYIVKNSFNIDSNTILDGNSCTIKSKFDSYYDYIIQLSNCSNTSIINLTINQSEVQDCSSNMNDTGTALVHRAQVIRAYDVRSLVIENSSFYYFGVSAIAVDSSTRPEGILRIKNCNFYFRRGNSSYDTSTIYAACTTNIITDNYINGKYSVDNSEENSLVSYGGIELHSPNSTLTGNTIINCGNAVNITPGDHSGTFLEWRGYQISNNIIGNCGKGIQLWCFGNIESSESNFKNFNINNNTIEIGPEDSTALNAIGIVYPSNGTIQNINVLNNIIRYTSKAAYHEEVVVAPGINFSGNCKVYNLNIINNQIIDSPANAILVSHTEQFQGYNINIKNNSITNCYWRSGYSIPTSDSYHYPISITYCNVVNIEDNNLYYSVNPTTNIYGLFYINNCTDVKVLRNKYTNTTKALLGGIETNCINEIFTDDVVTKAYYYKEYPNSFISNSKTYDMSFEGQLFIGDKIFTENNNLLTAIDTYNNAVDYIFEGSTTVNNRIIWLNRIPKALGLGTVLEVNNPNSGLVGTYVVSMISIDNQCMFLYGYIGNTNLNNQFQMYKGQLINEDGTLTSKVTII